MGGTVRQYEEGAVIVGDGGEGADKYESNSAITGNNIQDGGSDSASPGSQLSSNVP